MPYNAKDCMGTSKLRLNLEKTEFILFGSKRQRDRLKARFLVDILGSPLCPAESVKNLGMWFNSDFSLCKQKKFFFFHFRDFRCVRKLLTHDASHSCGQCSLSV